MRTNTQDTSQCVGKFQGLTQGVLTTAARTIQSALDIESGTLSFKLDNIITATGSSVQIGTGTVIIALPTIVEATGSSVVKKQQ